MQMAMIEFLANSNLHAAKSQIRGPACRVATWCDCWRTFTYKWPA